MSFWNAVKKQAEKNGSYVGAVVDEAKAKGQEHSIVLGDAWKASVGTLPSGYKTGLAAGLALTAVAVGGAAFFLGRIAREEPEAATGLKKAADLIAAFLGKTLSK